MRPKNPALFCLLVFVLIVQNECRRGSGTRMKTSNSRGSSVWNNNNRKNSGSKNPQPANADMVALSYPKQNVQVVKPKPKTVTAAKPTVVDAPKPKPVEASKPVPSAPKLENQNVQHSANTNAQKPIGWNVNQQGTKSVHNPQNNAPNAGHGQPPPYSAQGHPPPYSAQGQPPPYSAQGHPPPYGAQGPPPAYSPHPQGAPPAYGASNYGQHAPPAYQQNYNPNMNHGYHPQGHQGGYGQGHPNGGYGGGMGGYGGGMGGYGGGMGGYGGGMGGYGGYGMQQKSSGFGSGFARTAMTSAATGLLVWSLMRSGRSQNYNVYNYHNNPEQVPQEIPLPANVITLCAENDTLLCAPNTTPLCTSTDQILCVVTAGATIPCADGAGTACVNSTAENETISLPCIANATVSGEFTLEGKSSTKDSETVFCVTTMAMPSNETDVVAATTMAPPIMPPIGYPPMPIEGNAGARTGYPVVPIEGQGETNIGTGGIESLTGVENGNSSSGPVPSGIENGDMGKQGEKEPENEQGEPKNDGNVEIVPGSEAPTV